MVCLAQVLHDEAKTGKEPQLVLLRFFLLLAVVL
jgi:hypothetical protein